MTSMVRDIDKIPSQIVSTGKLDSGYIKQPANELTVGKWLLFLDEVTTDAAGVTELDRAWAKIVPLLERRTNKIIRIICSAATPSTSSTLNRKKGFIGCYTRDFKNIADVKQVALEIRAATNHSEILYYKAEIDSKLKKLSSQGQVDISLYKLDEKNKLFTKRYGANWFNVRDAQTLDEINPERLKQMEEESRMINSGTGNVPSEVELIPSRVTYKDYLDSGYIKAPKNKLHVGKWMLFLDAVEESVDGLTELDAAWAEVVQLTKQPGGRNIIRISCSTRASQRRQERFSSKDPDTGVIKCFTANFNLVSDVGDAARAIRRVTCYPAKLYYKMDVDPDYRGCSHDGYSEQSCYMDDEKDQLFVRNDAADWVPVGNARKFESLAPRRAKGIKKEMKECQAMMKG